MSPYREAFIVDPARWRVTWRQKLFVRLARWLALAPFDLASRQEREWRRYERALLRWHRDTSDWSASPESPARRRPLPVPPTPPLRTVLM